MIPCATHLVQIVTGQRHGGADVRASSEALPAVYMVKSEQCVVKNIIALLPRRTRSSRRNRRGHKTAVRSLKDSMFSRFRTMRDVQTAPRIRRARMFKAAVPRTLRCLLSAIAVRRTLCWPLVPRTSCSSGVALDQSPGLRSMSHTLMERVCRDGT